ncbi:hypothetical protein [Nocardia sp. NPDC051570]|uniref:hypothetical protein n=1 Tax=Nocardia sp. NPDC051570 TaxID=3364324 RepID=UPI0037B63AFE
MNRRVLLLITAGGAALLVPWIVFLAVHLPEGYTTNEWRLAWVGFDVLLFAGLGSSAWLGFRRRRAAVPVLIATAALLCCDAWFDVVLDWSGDNRWGSVLMAAGVEIPLGLLLALRARQLLAPNQPPRFVTPQEIHDIFTDPIRQQIMHTLTSVPVTIEALAAMLPADPVDVAAGLHTLEVAGFVHRDGDRWRKRPLDLRWPEPDRMSAQDWANFGAWQERRLAGDLELLATAARHPERYGPWVRGSRGGLRLTQEELGQFFDEYLELSNRYGALRDLAAADGPGRFRGRARSQGELRTITVRLYTFPQSFGES